MSNDITKWGAFRIRKSSPEFVKRTRKYLNQIYYWKRGRCLLDKILSMAKVGGCVGWKLCYIQFLPNDSKFDFLGHSNPRIRYDPAYLTSLANDDLCEPTRQKVVATKKEYVYPVFNKVGRSLLVNRCVNILPWISRCY